MALVGRGAGAIVRVAALALNELRQRNAEHFGSGERIEEAITEARGAGTVRQLVRALSDGDDEREGRPLLRPGGSSGRVDGARADGAARRPGRGGRGGVERAQAHRPRRRRADPARDPQWRREAGVAAPGVAHDGRGRRGGLLGRSRSRREVAGLRGARPDGRDRRRGRAVSLAGGSQPARRVRGAGCHPVARGT